MLAFFDQFRLTALATAPVPLEAGPVEIRPVGFLLPLAGVNIGLGQPRFAQHHPLQLIAIVAVPVDQGKGRVLPHVGAIQPLRNLIGARFHRLGRPREVQHQVAGSVHQRLHQLLPQTLPQRGPAQVAIRQELGVERPVPPAPAVRLHLRTVAQDGGRIPVDNRTDVVFVKDAAEAFGIDIARLFLPAHQIITGVPVELITALI